MTNHLLCLRPAIPGSQEQKPGDGMEATRIISPQEENCAQGFCSYPYLYINPLGTANNQFLSSSLSFLELSSLGSDQY
jgi:hypothetical protein